MKLMRLLEMKVREGCTIRLACQAMSNSRQELEDLTDFLRVSVDLMEDLAKPEVQEVQGLAKAKAKILSEMYLKNLRSSLVVVVDKGVLVVAADALNRPQRVKTFS